MRLGPVLLVTLGLVVGACGRSADVSITNARVGEPTGPNAALYFTASSQADDRLIGASTDVAPTVNIHETAVGDDGTMGMRHIDGLDLVAGADLVLEPGGYHLMLIDVQSLTVGDKVRVTLVWETAGEVIVDADVVGPADTAGHEGHDS